MKNISFIHAADLHLDSPMVGLRHLPPEIFSRLQESTFLALKKITDAAIEHQVDFVILAGDLFDGEDRSLRAQARLGKELGRLSAKGIPVYAVHGNHDHLGGSWVKMGLPEHVHVFSDTVEAKVFKKQDGTTVHLYGFSYPERHVAERMIDHYQRAEGADFHIGILHGHFEGASGHGKYAPFYIKDLVEKNFDYWALGHIHHRMVLAEQPPVIYPGNPQGRNRKEVDEKGCYLVKLGETGARFQFIETADIVWKEASADGAGIKSYDDLYSICREIKENIRAAGKGILLSLHFENLGSAGMLDGIIESGELAEILNEEEMGDATFVWVFRVTRSEAAPLSRDSYLGQGDFYTDLFTAIDQYEETGKAADPLFKHPSARKYLSAITEEEKALLLNEAEELLLQLLKQGGSK